MGWILFDWLLFPIWCLSVNISLLSPSYCLYLWVQMYLICIWWSEHWLIKAYTGIKLLLFKVPVPLEYCFTIGLFRLLGPNYTLLILVCEVQLPWTQLSFPVVTQQLQEKDIFLTCAEAHFGLGWWHREEGTLSCPIPLQSGANYSLWGLGKLTKICNMLLDPYLQGSLASGHSYPIVSESL